MLDECQVELNKQLFDPALKFDADLAAMMERGKPDLRSGDESFKKLGNGGLGPNDDTQPGVGPAADYPRLVVTKGSASCYLCARPTPGLLERSAFDRMPCCGECAWDLGYEAESDGHLRLRDP